MKYELPDSSECKNSSNITVHEWHELDGYGYPVHFKKVTTRIIENGRWIDFIEEYENGKQVREYRELLNKF
jgi:hypothetical protein